MAQRIQVARQSAGSHIAEIGMLTPVSNPEDLGVSLDPGQELFVFGDDSDIVPGDRFAPGSSVKLVERVQSIDPVVGGPGFRKGVITTTLEQEPRAIRLVADRATSERAGAGGCFQVVELVDDATGANLTSYIDQGKHYRTHDEVLQDLVEAIGDPGFRGRIEE